MKKIIIIDGGPRRNMNTANIIKLIRLGTHSELFK